MQNEELTIARLILPRGLLDFFTLSKVVETEKEINLHLAENNTPPEEFVSEGLVSKGFFEAIKVQDFPIRGRAVYLYIKRRRWINKATGTIVFRNWEQVAKGTRMTKEFAAFLKVIARYQTDKL